MTLADLFRQTFTERRSEVGLEWQGSSLTFGELDKRADRVAGRLTARGLRPGDRLSVQLPNGPELIDLFLACTRTGIIFGPVYLLYRSREIDHILRDSTPAAIVARGQVETTTPVEVWTIEDLKCTRTFVLREYAYQPRPNQPLDNGTGSTETLYWHPLLETDASGKAEISFELPDSAGNYRLLMTMGGELLAYALAQEVAQLDEKCFLEVFQPAGPRPAGKKKARV